MAICLMGMAKLFWRRMNMDENVLPRRSKGDEDMMLLLSSFWIDVLGSTKTKFTKKRIYDLREKDAPRCVPLRNNCSSF